MAKQLIILFLVIAYSGLSLSSSSSYRAPKARQTCGLENTNFYCPIDDICKPRAQRCTRSTICINPHTRMEDDCFEGSFPGQYKVRLGHAKLGISGSRKRESHLKPEHQFITFRGFTYEFGLYGVQILDVLDPEYKYRGGKNLKSKGIKIVGSSYCTWEDATEFANSWQNKKYNLFTQNCQYFADAMKTFLLGDMCNQPRSSGRNKRHASLTNYID